MGTPQPVDRDRGEEAAQPKVKQDVLPQQEEDRDLRMPDLREQEPEYPHTVLSESMITYLTYLLGYLALASSLTATIYFPTIDLLAEKYRTSVQAINITITLYVVFQGIAPSFFSPFLIPLVGGRYVALLLLRALQSVGGSAVLSLAYAVVADVIPHSRRGSVLGPMMAAMNLGPCIGPVLGGGAILASGNVRWCFVTLVAFRASALMLLGWTMSETGRNIVGNGAVEPHGVWATWWHALRLALRRRYSTTTEDGPSADVEKVPNPPDSAEEIKNEHDREIISAPTPDSEDPNKSKTGRGTLSAPSPLPSIRIFFYPDAALILWLCAAPYTVWYCIQTYIPLIYGPGYGFNDFEVGLCFLAGGGGVIAGGWIAGRLMDWSFRKTATEAGFPEGSKATIDIRRFPVEEARSRASIPIMSISMAAVIGYGWAVQRHTHPAVPLCLQFLLGANCTVIHQTYSALIVDNFSARPGTAGASNNICRCALSAGAVAVLQPIVKAIGYSWLFTLLALVEGIGSIAAVYALRRWGRRWRGMRDDLAEGKGRRQEGRKWAFWQRKVAPGPSET
ncbi:Uu.00g028100.m01.CDS01 [Anthostomella pinea]|uniref:Uu.00g028100.m01.CDS01 n=1 Tax=Anthostomella pinea TaxID=933095 RepID=A0AAI8V8C9_9PEZI|nr:Uu.00g028100.m01.CDS01 [Anthostomella pinea]